MTDRTHIPPFPAGTIEAVSRAIGDLYTGTEVNQLLIDTGLPLPIADGTKWRRIDASRRIKQNRQGDGRPLVALVKEAMKPDRTLAHRAEAATARDSLKQVLSLSGLKVLNDGRVSRTTRTTTDSEAAQHPPSRLNPSAHEPRVEWALSEHDALDVLGTVSLVHRRLDTVTVHRAT
ncbi:hypothetical protein GII33_13925 [Gordonia pseudamarae]|jgi:hypothetical protein|uniref:Uncharacterized protein n=1 Tax=Gordonia pseudamarae TaxID=2831662 RepID=A0ABX6IIR0_9ACTN|nr:MULTISPECIES: hypothetical protein [Gordonia]MBD0022544.1 hypothetical protein [Gordonia sp. (in: high G+C Gram-positive bacteria)]QHN26885.1 hypothetical protein GII33_13925 [Gordonia pseudamarae]QHN35775.1 hypothetical protein GII31_13750 [Gordonia pseudamarae]